jgi:hypothetical protein
MRKLDADGISESFVAILDDPPGKQVVARRILPVVTRDAARIAQLRARVGDLRAAQHPTLVPLFDLVEADGDLYVLEEWSEGVDLGAIIAHCLAQGTTVPHNVYLNLATQVCNALEALHARPGAESGSENVLHLALTPRAMWVTTDGRVTVGRYGLSRSPTAIATSTTGTLPVGVEYLAPEQTHQDQKLTPASDIFALGGILYELLTLRAMFRAESSLQTIHRVRRAEVTTQLLEVKEIMPGLDKVLFRALSLNPRHRYQRAFVLREDLRGLMAGYSFNDIETVTRAFLSPIVRAKAEQGFEDSPTFAPESGGDTTGFLLPSKGTASLPSSSMASSLASSGQLSQETTRDPLSVQDLPLLGEGEVEHTDALLAEVSESGALPLSGRGYDADQADTSKQAGRPSRSTPSRAPANDEGTGWIPRDLAKNLDAAPAKRPVAPNASSSPQALSAGLLPSGFSSGASRESTQDLLKRGGVDEISRGGDPLEERSLTARSAKAQEHTQPSPDVPIIKEMSRRPSEMRTMEVQDGQALEAPPKRVSAPKTRASETLLPPTDLRPLPEPHTRTLELDEPMEEPWADVPTASKHESEIISSRSLEAPARAAQTPQRVTPPPGAALPKMGELPKSSRPAEATAKLPSGLSAPPPPSSTPLSAGALGSQSPAPSSREATKPAERAFPSKEPATAKDAGPPKDRPPEMVPSRRELRPDPRPPEESERTRSTWIPVALGVFGAGMALAVCAGISAGAFLGLTGGAVMVEGMGSEPEQIAMAEPEPAPVEPVEVLTAPEPAVPPEPTATAAMGTPPEPLELGTAEAVPSVPKPAGPNPAGPNPAGPNPTGPNPTGPKPSAPVPREMARVSAQQPAQEIHKAIAAQAPPPAPRPAVAASPAPRPEPRSGTPDVPPEPAGLPVATTEIDRWAEAAYKGELSPGAVQQLASIPSTDPGYTRARTLLYLDAKAREDISTRDAHLAAMMTLPENRYNPVLLVEKALIAVDKQDWQTALKSSQTAEQHWARLPSELVFTRKAMIYEIEAVSNTGLFYASAGEDQDRLLQAIRGWQRYETHVRTKGRNDLVARAEENLNKLYEIQRRLE